MDVVLIRLKLSQLIMPPSPPGSLPVILGPDTRLGLTVLTEVGQPTVTVTPLEIESEPRESSELVRVTFVRSCSGRLKPPLNIDGPVLKTLTAQPA